MTRNYWLRPVSLRTVWVCGINLLFSIVTSWMIFYRSQCNWSTNCSPTGLEVASHQTRRRSAEHTLPKTYWHRTHQPAPIFVSEAWAPEATNRVNVCVVYGCSNSTGKSRDVSSFRTQNVEMDEERMKRGSRYVLDQTMEKLDLRATVGCPALKFYLRKLLHGKLEVIGTIAGWVAQSIFCYAPHQLASRELPFGRLSLRDHHFL